jgi:hypothetical protein
MAARFVGRCPTLGLRLAFGPEIRVDFVKNLFRVCTSFNRHKILWRNCSKSGKLEQLAGIG